ncbi:hypothetical protein BGZ73_002626 [Actinomortierella ambigua]|nr:hypothetical protein BGZ73_002626 [Actinomortierella ambigua]
MKGIQDATLVSMALPSDDPQGGVTIEGVARLRNPSSSLSVDLGKLTFGVYLSSDDQSLLHTADSSDLRHQYKVAELFCSHVELKAHETVDLAVIGRLLHMDDWVPVSPVLTALHILKSEKQFLLSRLLSRYIQGEDSVVAIRALPEPEMAHWLQVVVQSIALSVRFPGSPQKDFIEGIDMKQLSFGFDGNDTHPPSNSAEIRGRLTARLQLPKNVTFPITVAKLYPEVELSPLAPSDDSDDDARSWQAGFTPMARIVLPGSLPAKSTQNGNALQVDVSLESGKLVILPGREQAFYGFLNDSFTQDEITLGVTGQAKALVETGMGSFELGPIPFVTRTTQKGLGGLMGVPPKLEQIDIVDSTNRSLTIKARLMINNPSSISASLGSLSFFWGYNGFLVGLATVPSAVLQPGPNTVETIGMMDPLLDCRQRAYDPMCDPEEAAQAARAFLSGYISGDNTTAIDILGHEESTKIPLLHPLISSLRIRSTLPVMEQEFLLSTTMYLLSSMIVLELRNPLDTTIWILNINGTAFYKDEPLGHIRVNFERDIATPKPIEIPANDHQGENSGYVKTPRLPVSYELSSVGYEALKQALGGTLEVDVLCHIKARVGNMVQWIDYQKANVTANASGPPIPSSSSKPSSKGKAPLRQLPGATDSTAATAGSGLSSSTPNALSAIAGSAVDLAKNTFAALDPRHADVVRLNGAIGGGSSSSMASGKPSTSASQSTFQHASRAMETLSESSTSSSSSSGIQAPAGSAFRTPAPTTSHQSTGVGAGGMTMDWDSFLASPESDLIDDTPYRPPSMSSFSFSSMRQTSTGPQVQHHNAGTTRTWEQQQELWRSAHTSHAEDTIPAFAPPAAYMSTTTLSSDGRRGGGGALVSRMVQQQQMEDGMDVVAFLNSTSHADYVEALEAVEVDRHQQQRKQFQYDSGNNSGATHGLRQQDLPSDQQDIVAYAEGQRTIADDIDARPFAHDEVGQELRSLMSERAEQERFLQGMMSLKEGAVAAEEGKEATLEEMETIMDRVTLESQGSQGETSIDETKGEMIEKTNAASSKQAAAAAARKRRQQNGPRL